MERTRLVRALLGSAAAACLAGTLQAQTLTTETLLTGAARPVWVGSPPGDDRIFYCEAHNGAVRIIDGTGALLPTPFIDVGTVATGGEQGLLGMAFHPDFATNGLFYLNFTAPTGTTFVVEFQVSAGNPNVADLGSGRTLLSVDQPFSNHNAGDLNFSPVDGYLYIALGDGGSGNDPECRAQNGSSLLGKMLRIDVDNQDPGLEYAIPADNPYNAAGDGIRDEIWSFGLRNPWRFAFDPANGDVYIGDVGQGDREEVSYEPAQTPATNFGWPKMEGELCNNTGVNNCNNQGVTAPDCFDAAYTLPIHTYESGVPPFGSGDGNAIIGGEIYRGDKVLALQGTYFFADNGSSRYWSLEVDGGVAVNFQERTAELSSAGNGPTTFGVDGDGEILVATLNGRISRIVPDSTFTVDAESVSVAGGGVQNMSLHAGEANGGMPYLVLGSLSGTSPGLFLGVTTLPLNLDAYFVISIQGANNGAPFTSTFGVLDADGNATASFAAGPGLLPASAVGLTANHAYVLFNAFNNPVFASNATALTFDA